MGRVDALEIMCLIFYFRRYPCFCEAEMSQLGYLRLVLLFFQAVSGLRINISKSEILLVCEVENVEFLAHHFGCKVASLPSSYLGLPIGAPLKNKVM